MPTSPFNPDPVTTDAILQSIAAEYSLSLTDIAAQHNTTIEALTAWLTREDIDERLTAIESACARRARLTAANHLHAVAHVAKQALEEASDVLRLPPDYRTQRSIALRIRATESARRAAALLLRIANFTPGPRRAPRERYPSDPASPRVTHPPAPISAPPTENLRSATIPATPNMCMLSAATPTVSESSASTSAMPSAPVSLPSTETTPAAPADAPPTESTLPASCAAPRTESTSAAPTAAVLSNRAQSAPTSLPPAESTLAAPTSLPPAESMPSAQTSATSVACTSPAPHAATPNPTPQSPAIPAWFTLIPTSAVPAPHHAPAPNAHPPPRTLSRSLSSSASSRVTRA